MAKHAIVIGAGVAGLATAGLLAREGYHVRVFEKTRHPWRPRRPTHRQRLSLGHRPLVVSHARSL